MCGEHLMVIDFLYTIKFICIRLKINFLYYNYINIYYMNIFNT